MIYSYIYAASTLDEDLCLHKTEVVSSVVIVVGNMRNKQLKMAMQNAVKCQLEFNFTPNLALMVIGTNTLFGALDKHSQMVF